MSSPSTTPTVLLIGTCDTKLTELQYTRAQLLSTNTTTSTRVLLLDIGREPTSHPEIDIPETPTEAYAAHERQDYMQKVTEFTTHHVQRLYESHQIHAILALGGSCGTTVAAAAMRDALPIGFPKLMLSTMASGNIAPYVQETDITMMYSVVDIAGTNSILTRILDNAAAAAGAMAEAYFHRQQQQPDNRGQQSTRRRRIGITMFGVTTPCVDAMQKLLTQNPKTASEVYIFHATGSGGKAMERLIREGQLDAVIDLTTSEVVDEKVGGVLSAGPQRLDAAAARGIPQVVSVGACDMVNHGTRETVPEKFKGRRIFEHNKTVTLVRTSPEENQKVGEFIAEKLRAATRPDRVVVVLPMGGVSQLDKDGGPYWDPEADEVLFDTVEKGLKGSGVEVIRREEHVNDEAFARVLVETLGRLMGCNLIE
ncbi:Tm-1-like ATP-binding domain-containing protein [Aspergillus saccharolyticus JOP 1030-1]|uniref:UPF0261 domain protein n=1 Tax=Aspergillus saccharolyticus JOP 1030-1 TaxID=1450539 RepID=A0A318ZGU5_9EURO|nr:UPF0261 domain protein [Aspergillus saccharolyticus JOP 1030-1]PYH46205.1 UPF0261 domain protein [Aspergillus saccharolyticus JOP 1030-1]